MPPKKAVHKFGVTPRVRREHLIKFYTALSHITKAERSAFGVVHRHQAQPERPFGLLNAGSRVWLAVEDLHRQLNLNAHERFVTKKWSHNPQTGKIHVSRSTMEAMERDIETQRREQVDAMRTVRDIPRDVANCVENFLAGRTVHASE